MPPPTPRETWLAAFSAALSQAGVQPGKRASLAATDCLRRQGLESDPVAAAELWLRERDALLARKEKR